MEEMGLESGEAPSWAADLHRHLGPAGPLTLAALTERLRTDHPGLDGDQVERELRARGDVHETPDGWVSLLAIADGVVLTHVLSAEERQSGVLAADGDLDLWVRLADEGLALAAGGTVRSSWADLLLQESSAGLVGPDGWLDELEPETLLALRLRDGALEVTALGEPPGEGKDFDRRLETVVKASGSAAVDALVAYAEVVQDDELAPPGAMLDEVVADLLVQQPGVLDDPLPPLGLVLKVAQLEVVRGMVGAPGAPWDPVDTDGMSPEEIRRFVLVRGFLRTHDGERAAAGKPDQFLTLLTSSALVLERIADEVELDPMQAPLLEAARQIAATAAQRAAVALLAARSAEADGQPVVAEQLVVEALTHDPDLEPALRDAADYAATRGDAAGADDYLRRAGDPADDGLRAALRPLLASPPSDIPRNRPCPCGSGRKYKVCCLRKRAHPLSARAPARYASVATYARRAPGRETATELAALAVPEVALFALDLAIFEGGILHDYLDERGDLLPADERALVERWRETPLVPFEVTQVQPGVSATLRPLGGGASVRLLDRALSRSARRLDLLVARVLDDGDGPCLLALPVRVDRLRRRALLELFDGGYEPEEVAAFFGPQPPPVLQNREGHDLVQCAATYDVPDAEVAWGRLAAELDDDGPDRLVALHALEDEELVIRGSVDRRRDRWTVETNSIERLRDLQRQVLAAAPGARLVSESSVPVERLLAEHQSDPDTTTGQRPGFAPSGLPPQQVEALLDQVMREHELRWLDRKVPALGDRTPRQAVAEGGGALAELRALLDDMEWRAETTGGGMNAARVRRDLGLSGD
jgi:SEC-C motif